MITTSKIMIISFIHAIITIMNRALGFVGISDFCTCQFLKEPENASLLPYNGSGFAIQLLSPSDSIEVKRWHFGFLFKWVISLCLSLQEKQLVKLMQCTVTNGLEMPKAQQT